MVLISSSARNGVKTNTLTLTIILACHISPLYGILTLMWILHRRMRAATTGDWFVILSLGSILIVAALLRLYRLDLIDFRFDQAYALLYARDITQGLWWAVQPHGSVSVHPPVYLYVMALPYLFTRDFLAVVTYRVLLDVAGVGLCFLIGARYFSRRVGLIAALLYAIGPWAIQFARNMWPVPQPLFSAVLVIGLLELIVRRNRWGWAISGIGLALVVGTHLGGVYLVPVALIVGWLARKTLHTSVLPALIGAIPPVIVAGVYVLYDATQQFNNIQSLLSTFRRPATFSLDALQFGLWLSGGAHLSDLTGKAYPQWTQVMSPTLTVLDTLQMALLGIGCVVAAMWTLRMVVLYFDKRRDAAIHDCDPQTTSAFVLLLWWCIPIGLQLRYSQPVMLQYLPTLLPAPFLLMALGIDALLRLPDAIKRNAVARVGAWAISALAVLSVALIVVWQIATTLQFTRFVEQHDTGGGYGLPVRSALDAAAQARQTAPSESNPIVIVIHDYPTPWNEQAVILNDVLADMPHRFINANVDGWILRPEGVSYIFAPGTEQAMQELLGYLNSSDVFTQVTPLRAELNTGYLYVRVKGMPSLTGFTPARPASWESGVDLASYRLTPSTTHLRVETVLKVMRTPAQNVDYHWFNHLFAGANKLAQTDGSGIHPSSWRAGDYLLQRFDIPLNAPLPTQPLHVRIGSYTYPEVKGIMATEDGHAPDSGVNLALTVR
jgi:hypothetical protein